MTWGTPEVTAWCNPCADCEKERYAECRMRNHAGRDTLCQVESAEAANELAGLTQGPRRPQVQYLDVLTPGMVFTSVELAERSRHTPAQSRAWCCDHVKRGDLEVCAVQVIRGNSKRYTYRYLAPRSDDLTAEGLASREPNLNIQQERDFRDYDAVGTPLDGAR